MANQIELGIDVDSRDVTVGERNLLGLNKALQGTQKAMGAATGASTAFGRSIHQTTNLLRAAQGAALGFLGMGFIRSLIDTTANMQKINMTFQAVTGSAQLAAAEMAYVTKTADSLGQNVETAAGAYAKILAAASAAQIPLEDTRNIFEGITAAATAFGLTQYELEGALNAVQQMISKGSVQAEELRGQLGERLPGAFSIAAASMNMTVQELSKALELGKVNANDFVKAFGAELQERFGGFAQNAETTGRALNELDNAMLVLRKTIVEKGFQDAMVKVLDMMTGIAASAEASAVVSALGMAFKFMAEHAEFAMITLGLFGSIFFGLPALIAGAAAAILVFTQRTTKAGDETVKMASVIAEYWKMQVAQIRAAGSVIAAVWDFIVAEAEAIPIRLAIIWEKVLRAFSTMVQTIVVKWSNMISVIAEGAAKLPGEEMLGLADALNAEAASSAAYASQLGDAILKSDENIKTYTKDLAGARNAHVALNKSVKDFNVVAGKGSWLDAYKRATELSRATRLTTQKMKDDVNETKTATEGVAAAMEDTKKGAKGASEEAKKLKEALQAALEAQLRIEHSWNAVSDTIAGAAKQIAGGDVTGGLGEMVKGIGEALWGDPMKDAFEQVGNTLATTLRKALGGTAGQALSGNAAVIGSGIATAAVGVLNGSAETIGSGIGQALGSAAGTAIGVKIGGTLGSIAGPIGAVIGAALGAAVGSLFSGGGGSKWKSFTGTAFEGATFETKATARINTKNEGATAVARIAVKATEAILDDFQKELGQFVRASGDTLKSGVKLAVNEGKALQLITGVNNYYKAPGSGPEAEAMAKEIADKLNTVFRLAGEIASKGAPALTQAQVLWRQAQEQFSKENIAILKALGFSAREIAATQARVKRELAQGFNAEILRELVDTGSATKRELDRWRAMELEGLKARRDQNLAAAREIGADVGLVNAQYAAGVKELGKAYADALNDLTQAAYEAQRAAGLARLETLRTRLQSYEEQRSKTLAELTRRSDEARAAEEALADARKGLAASALAPGGPMDLFNTLKKQFGEAVTRAKGGDAGAAQDAAGLAQQLLGQGQQIYGSSGAYSTLFGQVNSALMAAQTGAGTAADYIDKQLDKETFADLTEKSTAALLKGLAALDARIAATNKAITDQTKALTLAESKRKVAA